MTDKDRLIERAFPLKQASLTSVHEKMCHNGHSKSLHIWPARRPLAACRAALLATLLPDPGTPEARQKLCERIGGRVVEEIKTRKNPAGGTVEYSKEEVDGGLLKWIGTAPKLGGKQQEVHRLLVQQREEELQFFRDEIKKAYGGRAPRVLDPFAGGGAIPLEAMRLGCETTAADLNPVAWFVLKCTLEFPQKLAGKTLPLPDFILKDEEFMEDFYHAHPHLKGKAVRTKKQQEEARDDLWESSKKGSRKRPEADLAWQVRAWGRWVLSEARKELAEYYPTYAAFESLEKTTSKKISQEPIRLVSLTEDGMPDIEALNAEFPEDYLADKKNPRWIAKPTVAYLWARTVRCKNCRAEVPLLKTRWLCKKVGKRELLTMEPRKDGSGVTFGIQHDVPEKGGNTAQKRKHDQEMGGGTMSRTGVLCPCCRNYMTMEDLRTEGKAGRLGAIPMAVVVEGQRGKEYRLPEAHEIACAEKAKDAIDAVFRDIPFGIPTEPTPPEDALGMRIPKYGFLSWCDLFTNRQLITFGYFTKCIRNLNKSFGDFHMPALWRNAITSYLSCVFDKVADYNSSFVAWQSRSDKGSNTFVRWALPMKWDFCENNILDSDSGGWLGMLQWITTPLAGEIKNIMKQAKEPKVLLKSATSPAEKVDIIVTDPPYYDAIPYSDCMDYFYVWLRRILEGTNGEFDQVFSSELTPKWNHEDNDGELIDDSSRHQKDKQKSKEVYEEGMARAFLACAEALEDDGWLIIVFANKSPDAWETLVSAIIRAGFIVEASWPIETEMSNRTRAMSSAALSSSVWLVCRKRKEAVRPGWDTRVLEAMEENIRERLYEYWDAGIRGPDFVWAATGPALAAYSQYPVVKKADSPGEVLSVGEFLVQVRRMVVDFVVGRILTGAEGASGTGTTEQMDAPTAYYLLHRNDFRLEEAPAGACILYATACGMTDREIAATWDLIQYKGTSAPAEPDPEEEEAEESSSSGSTIRLKHWKQRTRKGMGYEAPGGRPVPLIDQVHCLMHLWREGNVHKVNAYLAENALPSQQLFNRFVQSLIELADAGSEERSLLESLSNHIQTLGPVMAVKADVRTGQMGFAFDEDTTDSSGKEI